MANRFSLDCPLDGQSLAVNRTPDAIKPGGPEVDTHFHVEFNVTLSCSNGHRWLLQGDLVAKRIA